MTLTVRVGEKDTKGGLTEKVTVFWRAEEFRRMALSWLDPLNIWILMPVTY